MTSEEWETEEQTQREEHAAAKAKFFSVMEAAVRSLAEANGWFVNRVFYAGTGSRYIELNRCGEMIDADGDEVSYSDCIIVRLADHGTCYEREDFSLEVDGSGHSLSQVDAAMM